MLTEAEQAYLEGAKNLWRFNRGDIFNVACYIAVMAGLVLMGWLVVHAMAALPAEHLTPIHYGHIKPAHLPVYRPG